MRGRQTYCPARIVGPRFLLVYHANLSLKFDGNRGFRRDLKSEIRWSSVGELPGVLGMFGISITFQLSGEPKLEFEFPKLELELLLPKPELELLLPNAPEEPKP